MSDSSNRLSFTDSAPLPGLGDTRTWFTFSGTYIFEEEAYLWSLTSTTVIYEARKKEHWSPGQATRNDKTTWVKINQDFYAEVDKAYFANPKVEKMRTNGN